MLIIPLGVNTFHAGNVIGYVYGTIRFHWWHNTFPNWWKRMFLPSVTPRSFKQFMRTL